jgi:hypothetical protein
VAGFNTLSRTLRTPSLLAAIALAAVLGWLALVARHDPNGLFGESTAAWTQAIMSVGAILAAIVIDQGASRRDRRDRQEAADRARASRVKLIRSGVMVLENAAKAAASRRPARGLVLEGLAVEAMISMQETLRHFVGRGSEDDPILVWVLNRSSTEMDGAVAELKGRRLATKADQLATVQAAKLRAQALRELADEYEAGIY